jgi:hypothetical protein
MRILVVILLFCTCALFAASDATIENFTARSDSRNITLEWRASREVDILRYEVERSTGVQGDYKKVGTIMATGGQTTYRFVDENAYLRSGSGDPTATIQAAALYGYRLKIIGNDDKVTYTNPITVTHTVSSVRRTWGMIKEMFR